MKKNSWIDIWLIIFVILMGIIIMRAEADTILLECKTYIPHTEANVTVDKDTRTYSSVRMKDGNRVKITPEEGVKLEFFSDKLFTILPDMKKAKHSAVVEVPTIVGKTYTVSFVTDKPLIVWFSDSAAKHAKVDGKASVSFKPTKKVTTLWLQPTVKTTIKELNILAE
jgi:hypothetical protein